MKKKALMLLVLSLAVLGACRNSDDTSAAGSKFNDQGVEFVQQMIPHHRQAVDMAEFADSRAKAIEVKHWASVVQAAQEPEIKTMVRWLKGWNRPIVDQKMAGMGHGSDGGSPMVGMISDADMAALKGASGTEFDSMFLAMMIRHHQGAITMAGAEKVGGVNPVSVALANTIIDRQSAEITTMKKLLLPRSQR